MNKLTLPLYLRLNWAVRYLGVPKPKLRQWINEGKLQCNPPKKGAPRLLATKQVMELVEQEYGVPVAAAADLPTLPWEEPAPPAVVIRHAPQVQCQDPPLARSPAPRRQTIAPRFNLREAMREQMMENCGGGY